MHPQSNPGIVGAIPARYGSERLPGKVLRKIAGRTMIEHVYRRSIQAEGLDRVVVLTDDQRVAAAVTDFGGDCEMTPAECASGTDRVAWAARGWPVGAVINIQGDEPLIQPAAIATLARHLAEHPGDPVVTLATPAEPVDAENPNAVKVVTDRAGYALYFSRSPIPYRRVEDGSPGCRTLRHVGIYGYQRSALLRLSELEPSPLETAESLEQLRALENGIRIRVIEIDAFWWGVDTMEDLERTEDYLRSRPEELDGSQQT